MLLLSRTEAVTEKVAAAVGLEYVKVYHQSGHLLRHGDGHCIVVLGLILVKRDGARTYIYIAHAHAREFLWPDAHIMG